MILVMPIKMVYGWGSDMFLCSSVSVDLASVCVCARVPARLSATVSYLYSLEEVG